MHCVLITDEMTTMVLKEGSLNQQLHHRLPGNLLEIQHLTRCDSAQLQSKH
jgi:hypothetical protein